MHKRNIFVLSSLVFIALILGAFIWSSNSNPLGSKSSDIEDNVQAANTDSITSMQELQALELKKINEESIFVQKNSPEFDIQATLIENGVNNTYLNLQFYFDGISKTKMLTEKDIPMLSRIFENRERITLKNSGYRISGIYLNAKNAKIYIFVEGKQLQISEGHTEKETEGVLYVFDLKEQILKEIFKAEGEFTVLSFNNAMKYFAFSYTNGKKLSSNISGSALFYDYTYYVQVFDCEKDSMLVNKNMNLKQQSLRKDISEGIEYYYSFLSWNTNSLLKLMESQKNSSADNKKEGQLTTVVEYDVEKQEMKVNAPVAATPQNTSPQNVTSLNTTPQNASESKSQVTPIAVTESDALIAVRNYYLYLTTGQYEKIQDTMHDSFKLKLKMLEQFGIKELIKTDIDVDSMKIYGGLFKNAKIESIVQEKTDAVNSTIYLVQTFTFGTGEPIKQAIIANLKKDANKWKMLSVVEVDGTQKPFVN